jgi:bla regulator protein blaR1
MSLALIGWTVLQSLWQWALVGGILVVALAAIPVHRADRRHRLIGIALGLMVTLAVATAIAAGLRIEPRLRMDAIYAFDGALLIPALSPIGATLLRGLGAIWVAGFVWQAIRVAFAWRRMRALRRHVAVDPDLSRAVEDLRQSLGIARDVAVGVSARAHVPMVIGWRRPMILLPIAARRLLTPGQQRMILAHELAHVRRLDGLANLVQIGADLVIFHHPVARWLSRRLRAEREYCCDDVAARAGGDVAAYARALAALEDSRGFQPFAVAASGTLLDRIGRLAGRPRPPLGLGRSLAIGAASLVVSTALFAVAANVPPPWVPAGVRLRTPKPPGGARATPSPAPGSQPRSKRPPRT